MKNLLPKYKLPTNFVDIQKYKKNTFKQLVNKAVNKTVLEELIGQCKSLKKTQDLVYDSLKMQEYLKLLYPNQAKIILKSRCQTLNIKTHNTFKYKSVDPKCRKCGIENETFEHVVNCQQEDRININVCDLGEASDLLTTTLARVAIRVDSFLEQ